MEKVKKVINIIDENKSYTIGFENYFIEMK